MYYSYLMGIHNQTSLEKCRKTYISEIQTPWQPPTKGPNKFQSLSYVHVYACPPISLSCLETKTKVTIHEGFIL